MPGSTCSLSATTTSRAQCPTTRTARSSVVSWRVAGRSARGALLSPAARGTGPRGRAGWDAGRHRREPLRAPVRHRRRRAPVRRDGDALAGRAARFEAALDTISRLLAGRKPTAHVSPLPDQPVEVWIGGQCPEDHRPGRPTRGRLVRGDRSVVLDDAPRPAGPPTSTLPGVRPRAGVSRSAGRARRGRRRRRGTGGGSHHRAGPPWVRSCCAGPGDRQRGRGPARTVRGTPGSPM